MSELTDKAIADLVKIGKTMGAPLTVEGGNTPFLVIPNDTKVASLAEFIHNDRAAAPVRKKGTVKVLDAASFCEYYTLFHDENSRVFADETKSTVLAVLDYHGALEGGPRWGQHRIDLTMRHSEEWERWNEQNHKRTAQMEFAEFIEDNAPDIVSPDGATMLEVARDLSAKTDVDFSSAVKIANGSVQFKYNEATKGTFGNGQVDVPERFIISIPVYIGCDRVSLTARLRYRIHAGKLTFWYDLLRSDAAERDAFLGVHKQIADTLGITIINGTPAA